MSCPQRKLYLKTTTFKFNGRPTMMGMLREKRTHWETPLLDTPRVVSTTNNEHGTRLRLPRHKALDQLLTLTDDWKEIRGAFSCPAREGIAYERPGTKLGKYIILFDDEESGYRVLLPTGKYRGEKGIALVIPNLASSDIQGRGRDMIINVPDSRLIRVPDFPCEDGWYMPHKKTGIPHGKRLEYSRDAKRLWTRDFSHASLLSGYMFEKDMGYPPEARHLWRRYSAHVGLIVRHADYYGKQRRHVDVACGPAFPLGVAVEVPKKDARKIQAL